MTSTSTLYIPGDEIVAATREYIAGEGTFAEDGIIRATVIGHAEISGESDEKTVRIIPASGRHISDLVLVVGDEVHAQVMRIGINQIHVEIFSVGTHA